MSDKLTASIRTIAALAAGVAAARLATLGIAVDEEWLTGAMVVLFGAGWHALASELQRRWPDVPLFRLMLIAGRPPTYRPPTEPFDQPAIDPFNRPAG